MQEILQQQQQQRLWQLPLWSLVHKEGINSLTGTGTLEYDITQYMCPSNDDLYFFLHMIGCICVIVVRGGPMLSHLCAATPALYILWITMAQIAGQEDREKTTALKGKMILYIKVIVIKKWSRALKTWEKREQKKEEKNVFRAHEIKLWSQPT